MQGIGDLSTLGLLINDFHEGEREEDYIRGIYDFRKNRIQNTKKKYSTAAICALVAYVPLTYNLINPPGF